MDTIPEELFPLIFTHVDPKSFIMVVPNVSRGWKRAAAKTPVQIDLGWCSGHIPVQAARIIAERAPKAVAVLFEFRHNITNAVLAEFAIGCTRLKRIRLNLCRGITDDAILHLLRHCRELTDIAIFGCKQLTPGIIAVIANSRGPNLERFEFSCIPASDAAIETLADRCKNLRFLCLQGAQGSITDAAIIAIANQCSRLEAIDLESCTAITDNAVDALARQCPRLTSIDLTGNPNITPRAVIGLRNNAKAIKNVAVGFIGPDVAHVAMLCFGSVSGADYI